MTAAGTYVVVSASIEETAAVVSMNSWRIPRAFAFGARSSLFSWCNHIPKPAFEPFQGIMKLDILAIHRLKAAPID